MLLFLGEALSFLQDSWEYIYIYIYIYILASAWVFSCVRKKERKKEVMEREREVWKKNSLNEKGDRETKIEERKKERKKEEMKSK